MDPRPRGWLGLDAGEKGLLDRPREDAVGRKERNKGKKTNNYKLPKKIRDGIACPYLVVGRRGLEIPDCLIAFAGTNESLTTTECLKTYMPANTHTLLYPRLCADSHR